MTRRLADERSDDGTRMLISRDPLASILPTKTGEVGELEALGPEGMIEPPPPPGPPHATSIQAPKAIEAANRAKDLCICYLHLQ